MEATGPVEAVTPGYVRRRPRKGLRNPNPETAARVLAAAGELIAGTGFRHLRIDEVAARAGVSVGTFYLYFDGKDDLVVRLVEDHVARLRRRLAAAVAPVGGDAPSMERLRRALHAYLGFVDENQAVFLCALRDSGTVTTTAGRLSTWAADELAAELRPVVEEAMARGELRRDDPVLLAQAAVGLVQHLAGFWLEHRHHCSRQELGRFLDRLLA